MATRTISTRLAIEGEADYKQKIAEVNSALKTMRSELALVESKYQTNANSMEALTAKSETLGKVHGAQKQKVEELRAALENAQAAEQKYADQVAAAQAKISGTKTALESLKKSTGDNTKEQEALSAELKEYQDELRKAEQYQRAAAKGVNEWQRQVNYAERDLNELTAEIEKNDKYLDEARTSADKCATSIDQFGKETKEAKDEAEDFGDKSSEAVDTLAAALAAAGVAATIKEIAAALRECVEAASTFESGMAEVFTLLPDLTAGAREKMSADMLTFSSDMNVLTTEAVPALYQAISAGVPDDNVFSFLGVAQKAAIGGVTNLGTAVDGLTSIVNSYGSANLSAQMTADMLFTAVKLGKTNFEELSGAVYNVVPIAASAGVKLEDISAALAAITARGTPTRVATTQLRQVLAELTKEGSQVDKTFQEIAGVGFTQFIAQGGNLQGALQLLEKEANGSGVSISNMFSSVEAGQAALSLTGGATEKFTEALNAMENSSGAVDAAYETMADTAEFQSQRVETAMGNLKTSIGDALLPAFRDLASGAADGLAWADELIKENPWIVEALTAITIALGTLTVGVTAYTVATKIANAVAGVFTTVMAGTAGPLILMGAALTGVVAAIGLFSSSTREATGEAGELIKSIRESRAAHEEAIAGIDAQKESTLAMVSALEDAVAAEDKTAAQKEVILGLVDELNESVPNLGLAYDEYTGELNMTEEAIRGVIEAEIARQVYAENEKDLVNLEIERERIEGELAAAHDKLTESEAHFNEVMKVGTASGLNYTLMLKGASGQAEAVKNNIAELEEEQRKNAEAYEEQLAACEEYINSLNDLTGAGKGNQDQNKGTTQSIEELEEASKALTSATSTLTDAQDGLTDALMEQQENGQLSFQTISDLIDNGYALALQIDDETGAITLNEEAYLRLTAAKIDEQIASAQSDRQAILDGLSDETIASNNAAGAVAALAAANYDRAISEYEVDKAVAGAMAGHDANIATLERLKNSVGNYSFTVESAARNATRASRSAAAASKKQKTQAQEDLETFKGIQADLKHQLEMGAISQEQYYAGLREAQQKYLSDPANLEASRRIDEEVHKYTSGLETYKRLRKELDFELESGAISQEEFYRRLTQLRDDYLTDEASLEEWQKATLEIQGYNSGLETYKRLRKQLDHELAVGAISEADYWKKVAQARDEFLTDESALEERWKADEELYDHEQKQLDEYGKLLEQSLEDYEKTVNEMSDSYKDQLAEVQSAMDELQQKQDAMSEKLAGYGDLFTIDDRGNVHLEDLKKQTDAIQEYGDMLAELKDRGIDGGLLNEIIGMGVDEGAKYGSKLLKMSDKDWDSYNQDYRAKQDEAVRLAKEYYQEQMGELGGQYDNILNEAMSALKDTAFESGGDTADGLIDGMKEKRGEVEDAAAELATAAIKQFENMKLKMPSLVIETPAVDGSHAGGLSYVPYDGYLAELHQGERVLTASEAKAFVAASMPSSFELPARRDTQGEQLAALTQLITQNQSSSGGESNRPIHIELTAELDGAVLARKSFDYNQREGRLRGKSFTRRE